MADTPRLIEHAFPLKQASLDSVHEKNVRHGHISTLHIWPARRPLAACRAALIATLLPDPGTPEKRQELCEKIGGKVVKKTEAQTDTQRKLVEREKGEGGICTGDGRREQVRRSTGSKRKFDLRRARAQSGPVRRWRLLRRYPVGCETTPDINPVAWFIPVHAGVPT